MTPLDLLYVCGITPEWPASLRPLPPLDSGAPHGNILRLVEYLSAAPGCPLKLRIVSAASPGQTAEMAARWPEGSLRGEYHWVRLPPAARRWSAWWLAHFPLSSGVLNRLWGAHSLQCQVYLRGVRRLYRRFRPGLVVLDDAPQYIRGLARFVPRRDLVFYCRGDMGSSRRFIHWPGRLLVTNQPLGEWLRQVNPQVRGYAVVPNSLPPEYLSVPWQAERFAQKPRQILFVGRITAVKGLQYLLPAFALLRAQAPDARLVVVGAENPGGRADGSRQATAFEAEMRALAARLLPPEAIDWKGWLPAEALRGLYQGAYLAVYPSTWIEGFGMVALEAMACGTPVIVSNRPGFASLAGQGGGLIVDDPTDIAALAQAMSTVLLDPLLAQTLGAQGYQVARRYAVEQAADCFMQALSGGVDD
jgi:glycosyltransferase involved in cell wall biosynthesis